MSKEPSCIKVCSGLVNPETVKVASATSDVVYLVITPTMHSAAICDCPGYIFRGSCRHCAEAANQVCKFITADLSKTMCPLCGRELKTYEYAN